MSISKIITLVGLSVLLAACSTARIGTNKNFAANDTTVDKGVRYLLGRGVPQSDAKAFYYFNRAAKEGDPFAENELAYMYAAGRGTVQDYQKALHYYRLAANHGLASAQYNLALMYLRGLGTPPDKEAAFALFGKSAASGFEPARKTLQNKGQSI